MILNYSFRILHSLCLFIILQSIWCFSEYCINDSTCLTYGLQCRLKHCLCPSDKFWAGSTKNCISCPSGWINLYIFCIYHQSNISHWLTAVDKCEKISPTSRLLEIHNLNEYYFIKKSIEQILVDTQMKIEINNSKETLSSAVAFIGSQGTRISTEKWIYQFGNNSNNSYTSTSPMWCKEKHWNSTIISVEQPWEQDNQFNLTFQALKRWNDSNDACLVSLIETSEQSFLCEIAGDSKRFNDSSILSFLFTEITSVKATKDTIQNLITNNASLLITKQLNTSDKPESDVISNASFIKDKPWLLTIIIIVSVLMILIILIIIIAVKFKKKDSSKQIKSSSHSTTDKKTVEDLQSNNSIDTPFSSESATSKSIQSGRLSIGQQYSPSNSSRSISADKVALWDVMESSIASSTARELTKSKS